MRALFFHATASVAHPKVLGAFEAQARNTLRPFNQFLGQAIHTARERQFRYQLPWERVRNLISLRLERLDTLLRVPRRQPGLIITNWPDGKVPDVEQHAFVTNRGVPVRIDTATPTPQGLLVRTRTSLLPTDRLLWCGVDCAITQEAAPRPPQELEDLDGNRLKLLGAPGVEGEQHWLLRVEGVHHDGPLRLDGEEVEAEVLPALDGPRKVTDAEGRSFTVTGEMLRCEELPAEGPVHGSDGLRYRWHELGAQGRRGSWVQLLPPERSDSDEFLDPRAAFCEGDITEVWTAKSHRPDQVYKVRRVDPDRYQLLLDRLPPEGTTLFLPIDLRNLYLQKRALRQLSEAPLPHHQGLMRLCEDPLHARWPTVHAQIPAQWRALTDPSRSGTNEQRSFVAKALGSPDFAFLEGPPGSGKTTAICELVQQLVERGERVLLCASTHVAIDNVLERLLGSGSPIDAVRIGRLEKVDDKVQEVQIDSRIDTLVRAWRLQPELQKLGETELIEMAERTLIMAANLTCGTTMGIVNHPLFRGRDEHLHVGERPITTMPHWDVLIVDEASKTLIQEFMVPALMARRWIIVGDVRQLPPFADRADIVANLRDLVIVSDSDRGKEQELFPRDHQRACLLLFRLLRDALCRTGQRWLIVEPPGVLGFLGRELAARSSTDLKGLKGLAVVRVGAKAGSVEGPVSWVTLAQLQAGAPEALQLASADWVLVADDLLREVARWLPSNLLLLRELSGVPGPLLPESSPLFFRQAWWRERAGALQHPYRERKSQRQDITTPGESQACETDWLRRNDLGQELAWRLTRLHELRHSRNAEERARLDRDLKRLQPAATDLSEPIAEIQDIGLPSILEVLQEGIGVERSKRPSALTEGLRRRSERAFQERFESLSYQHRMHADISEFPRQVIYHDSSLKDANTIQLRDGRLGWDFGRFSARRVWAHVRGREHSGENPDEVRIIEDLLREFIAWAKKKGPPAREAPLPLWEVACLCFYVKQERAISQMLQELTGRESKTRFRVPDAPVEVTCGTVDRFQGREADLVMLSMRNTQRVGFLDSPNRLNVAVTRARQQLVVVGDAEYFADCGVDELQELARRTPQLSGSQVRSKRGRP